MSEPLHRVVVRWGLITFGVICLVTVFVFAVGFGNRSYSRYQRVKDATNEQRVIEMRVVQTEMLVKVETQKAAIRVAEANGIADSQRIIDSSLTEDYLTYLAIQAQMSMANGTNHTVIYIPVGDNGIPLVRDTATDEGAQP